jgi:surfeit locus 1 family protein
MANPPPHRKFWAGLVLLPGALAVLLALGTWQVQRLILERGPAGGNRTAQPARPVDLQVIEESLGRQADRIPGSPFASGRFVNDKEQPLLCNLQGQSGYYVYTPLELADGRLSSSIAALCLMIARSPRPGRKAWSGAAAITGLARARLAKSRPSWFRTMMKAANIFYWKDLDRMAACGAARRQGAALLPRCRCHPGRWRPAQRRRHRHQSAQQPPAICHHLVWAGARPCWASALWLAEAKILIAAGVAPFRTC